MGISAKFGQAVNNIQVGAKSATMSIFLIAVKAFTAFIIGLTLSMVGQELFSYGTISFVFVLVTTIAVLMKTMLNWGLGAVLIFDLISVLMALLLRMYILIAP